MAMAFNKALWFIIAALLLAGVSAQQDERTEANDMLFVRAAAQSNVYEIGAARHAVQNVQTQDVKDFAQQIIDDHTKTSSQLIEVAGGMGVQPNSDMTDAQQLNTNALSAMNGAELESAYLEQQVLAHQEAVSLFETASGMVQSQELQTFIDETLPVLEEHLQMAQELVQARGSN
jgi:putative membrane protein